MPAQDELYDDIDREALMRVFHQESEEGLVEMEQALVAYEDNPADTEALQADEQQASGASSVTDAGYMAQNA